jgi:hypothetical protein
MIPIPITIIMPTKGQTPPPRLHKPPPFVARQTRPPLIRNRKLVAARNVVHGNTIPITLVAILVPMLGLGVVRLQYAGLAFEV